MKKTILHLLVLPLMLLAACSNDDGDSTITISKDQLKQSAYADDAEKGITFTATEAWRTEVDYAATKAETTPEQWVSLDPPSGEAGEVTIKVVLSTNYTGADRKATIRIICGNTTITVVIEQKGTDQTGEVPDEEDPAPLPEKKVGQIIQYGDGEPLYVEVSYNAQGQLSKIHAYKMINGNRKDVHEEIFTYSDNRIVTNFTGWDDGYVRSSTTTYTLSNGRISHSDGQDDYGTRKETYEYDDAGRLIKYTEVSNDEVSYASTYTYTWENDLLMSCTYAYGSSVQDNYRYEYYDSETVPFRPTHLVLSLAISHIYTPDLSLYGWTGTTPRNFIKKVTGHGDEWDTKDGSAVYRYETDPEGYITKIYYTSTPAGQTTQPESLYLEFIYE